MFGKLSRVVIYAGVAAIVFLFGTQVFSVAINMAIGLQYGEFVSLLFIGAVSIILLRFSRSPEDERSTLKIALRGIGAFSMIFVVLVVFLANLRYGIILSTIAGSLVMCSIYILSDPYQVFALTKEVLKGASVMTTKGADRMKTITQILNTSNRYVYIIPSHHWDDFIEILKLRPMLPVALLHLQEEDLLIVNASGDTRWPSRIEKFLYDLKITDYHRASPLASRIALSLPILQSIENLDDYVIIHEEEHVTRLLKDKPLLMSVHPDKDGLRVIVTAEDAIGMSTFSIPHSEAVRAIIARDISQITMEVGGIAH